MQKKLENFISGQGLCPKGSASYLNHLNSHPIFSPTLFPIKENSVFALILNGVRFSLFGQTTAQRCVLPATVAVIDPPERKLAKRTSVYWIKSSVCHVYVIIEM